MKHYADHVFYISHRYKDKDRLITKILANPKNWRNKVLEISGKWQFH